VWVDARLAAGPSRQDDEPRRIAGHVLGRRKGTIRLATDLHFDLYDREIYASPYPTFRRLREEAPLYRNEQYDFWAVSRHEDVARVLSQRETFSSAKGGVYQMAASGMDVPEGLFIFEDPPLHAIHRGLVSRLFTPRAIGRIEADVAALFEAAADALVGAGRVDFIKDFANMLPIQVIGMLLGLPAEDHVALRTAFHQAQNAATADVERNPLAGMAEIARWFTEYLDFRAEHPTDDLMTQLLNTEFEDHTGQRRQLRRDELLTFLIVIAGAGSDTTVNAIGWAGSLLADHPEQRKLLVDDPSLIPNAVEEVLRFESIAYHICRTTTTEVELHGQTVPAGAIVVTLPGSANRDDRNLADGDTFDLTRKPGQMYSFSFGPHFCLGASLARMETRLAIESFTKRFPEWAVDHDGAKLTGGIDTRGWDNLPVDL
jgi:cytochrome P450